MATKKTTKKKTAGGGSVKAENRALATENRKLQRKISTLKAKLVTVKNENPMQVRDVRKRGAPGSGLAEKSRRSQARAEQRRAGVEAATWGAFVMAGMRDHELLLRHAIELGGGELAFVAGAMAHAPMLADREKCVAFGNWYVNQTVEARDPAQRGGLPHAFANGMTPTADQPTTHKVDTVDRSDWRRNWRKQY